MKRIVLISCVKTKLDHPTKAEDLYISNLFKNYLAYARYIKPDLVFILSAKYGLLKLDEQIAPYEKTLNNMPVNERRTWSEKVISSLHEHADLDRDEFIILAGEKYREYLVPHLMHHRIPFKGVNMFDLPKAIKEAMEG